MSLLCYNCRGLGNDPAVVRLRGLLRREDVEVVILLETKLSASEMRSVMARLGGYDGVAADSIGRSAGVAILWKEGIEVNVLSLTTHHLDVAIRGLFGIDQCRLTGFYGWSRHEDKWRSWQLLRELKGLSNLPWVVIGDFNEILFEHEKLGGVVREQADMDAFREVMDECGLIDIGYEGKPFTWWNKRGEPDDIYERLDRALVTTSFIGSCPSIMLHHLEADKSDHVPIKLALYKPPRVVKAKKFRFEDIWVKEDECEGVIKEAWRGDLNFGSGSGVFSKMTQCKVKLLKWSRLRFGVLRKQIEETRMRLCFLDSCAHSLAVVEERKDICARLDVLLMAEEGYWRQRSRVNYLTEGDMNTKFFHFEGFESNAAQ